MKSNTNDQQKRAVLYLRVSTEEQVDNFSLDTQEEICRKEAEKRGYTIVDIFREEGKSAKSIIGRPMLIKLLEYCRKNQKKVSAVFVYRLDRISRQTSDYLAIRKKLAEKEVTIISATEPTGDSPTEKLVETILAGFAQLDNDIRSERAKNGLRARFLAGLISGKAPIGYQLQGGFAVKDPDTWDRVKDAWDLMATGSKSIREMAKIMNDWGLREIHGRGEFKLGAQTVQRIFRSKFYAGYIRSSRHPEEVRGQHVPMITEQQFYKVQAILDGRNLTIAHAKRTFENKEFPLRRIMKCGSCGAGFTGAWSRGTGGRYGYYWCAKRCTKLNLKVDTVESTVINTLKEITPTEDCLNLFTLFLHKIFRERASRLIKLKTEADAEIERLKALRKTLVEKNLTGVYSDEVFKEQNAMIEEKMTKAQILKEDTLIDKYNIESVTDFMKILLADLGETYKRSSIPQIKVLFSSMFTDGISWNEKGTLNYKISPLYGQIRNFSDGGVASGAEEETRTLDVHLGRVTFYH